MCDRAVLLDHGRVVVDGTAVEGVRRLRDMYSEEAEATSSHRQETVAARITQVRLDGSATATPRLAPGDPLTIDIDVESHEPVRDWAVGIALLNHGDLVAYGTNTHVLGRSLPPLDGRATVRFSLPSLALAEDTYHVTVAVHPTVGPEWHRLDRVRAFRVVSEQRQDGVVFVAPVVEVAPAMAPAGPAAPAGTDP